MSDEDVARLGAGRVSTVPAIDDEVASLVERLVRLADSCDQHRCYLLLDPVLRNGLDTLHEVMGALDVRHELDVRQVRVAPADDYARKRWPLLVGLPALDTLLGSELSHHAARMMVEDWGIESLREGRGHRVCGWLFSRETGGAVASHLGRWAVQRRPDGRRTMVRFWDPAVLDQLWAASDAAQRASLLGPVACWVMRDRWGELAVQAATMVEQPPEPRPKYTHEQWTRLDHVGPINRLWVKARARGAVLAPSQMAGVEQALRRADAAGIRGADDLLRFAWCAITVASDFDSHPLVRNLLEERAQDETFGYAIAELDESDWRRISDEVSASPAI